MNPILSLENYSLSFLMTRKRRYFIAKCNSRETEEREDITKDTQGKAVSNLQLRQL